MAEVKKKQEEGSFGSGLLAGLKQVGSDLMDFLQTPEAMQFGAGILNSKSPGVMGFIGDGYQAYQDAKQKNLDNAFKRQMLQLDAALKVGKALEMQSKIGARNDHKSALNARDMGMGGGTPSSGRGAPTLGEYQNANLRFREEPPVSTKQSEGNELTPPRGMSIDAQIAAGYPVSDEEALAADQKKLQIPSQPTTPSQAGGYQQQFGQGQQQAGFAPQAQSPDEQYLRKMAAQGYMDEGNFGKAWETMMGDKPNWTLKEAMDSNGNPMLVQYNPQTRQMVPVQGVMPYEKKEPDVRINLNRTSQSKRYEEELGKFQSEAAASIDMVQKMDEIVDQYKKNPNLKSGPGTQTMETLKRGMYSILGAPEDSNGPAQQRFMKSLSQVSLPAAKKMQAATGSKSGLTNQEFVEFLPLMIASLENTPEGIIEIANIIKAQHDPILEGYEEALKSYDEWNTAIQNGVDPGFNLDMEFHVIAQEVARKKTEGVRDYLDQQEEFQKSRKESK